MRFLIIELDPVVMIDIQLVLADAFPSAQIDSTSSIADLPAHLDQDGKIVVIMDADDAKTLDAASLAAAVSLGGGWVLFGDDHADATGLTYLGKPFRADMLLAAVRRCLARPG